jgi:hypothetical protein
MEFSKWEISKGKKENSRHQNVKFEKFPLIVHELIFEIKHIEYLLTLSSISGQEKYRLCSPDDTGF